MRFAYCSGTEVNLDAPKAKVCVSIVSNSYFVTSLKVVELGQSSAALRDPAGSGLASALTSKERELQLERSRSRTLQRKVDDLLEKLALDGADPPNSPSTTRTVMQRRQALAIERRLLVAALQEAEVEAARSRTSAIAEAAIAGTGIEIISVELRRLERF